MEADAAASWRDKYHFMANPVDMIPLVLGKIKPFIQSETDRIVLVMFSPI